MYSVETEEVAVQQVAALPAEALPFYAELMTVLEITPWSGEAYNRQRPDANMRNHVFGKHGEGLANYLILDDQRRVVVLRVLWVG
ncbi:MAG TPA: hypothetical protein VN969_16135 [Streptosporangiaceae bacterium]|jgi:hypothetical protein|nr:hypothetical protein [Streptosporangiaceae bacterium]